MVFFLGLLVNGVCVGFVYALIALGFVIIFKCSKVFNIAQGAFVLIGAYLGWWCLKDLRLPFWLCFLIAIAIAAIIGFLLERLVMRRLVGQPLLATIMVTIALLGLLDGLVCLIWGGRFGAYDLGPHIPASIRLGELTLPPEPLIVLGVSVIVVVILALFFRYSRQGLAMKATAENEQVAQTNGIRVNTVYAQAWMIASILGVIGGIFLGSMSGASLGLSSTGLKALGIALLGGLDSIPGSIVAGIIIGCLENVSAGYLDPLLPGGGGFASVFPFIVMIIMLIFKPYGLFGLIKIERI
jgi:branched-chain amino acid transport system permease protein